MNLAIASIPTSHLLALDKLQQIPTAFWWNLGTGILIAIAAVNLLRKIRQVNRVLLFVGVLIAGTAVSFNWIYERNEPTWATPTVQLLAGFFPPKGRV